MSFRNAACRRFQRIYGVANAGDHADRLVELIKGYGFDLLDSRKSDVTWNENDVVVITYGDMVQSRDDRTPALRVLENFLDRYLGEVINTVHLLPFFPSSSDAGFSVVDYGKVREDLGDWKEIERLAEKYTIMADLVINHTSRFSRWFKNFQKGETPGRDYFIEVDPSSDISDVTRPRSTSLLTAVWTHSGLTHVWTTFSDDQIDLDFSNPEVLFEFLDIFLFYLSKGISIVRLDAIAYLWKREGTSSIHLEETHQVVKLFRDIVDYTPADTTLITETNVPFEENVRYFGEGDEAQMIYQFSLPPLLLHAILSGNATWLNRWAKNLPEPPEGCAYFNFTASHDGIGLRPLEGLVPEEDIQKLVEGAKRRGGFVSYKTDTDGSPSPYELNISWFDAFETPGQPRSELQLHRFRCSQLIKLALQGIPGIYFHNLTATENYMEGVLRTGEKREINRRKWKWDELRNRLEDKEDLTHRVFHWFRRILKIRRAHPAFSPRAGQRIGSAGREAELFAIHRKCGKTGEKVLAVSNVTEESRGFSLGDFAGEAGPAPVPDLLGGEGLAEDGREEVSPDEEIRLEPLGTVWLQLREPRPA